MSKGYITESQQEKKIEDSKMKKILILANNDIGLYNFRKELLERLLKENYKVYISLPMGDRVKEMEEMGCHYIETEINRHGMNPFQDLKLLLYYKKIMKECKPDYILGYTIKPNIYGAIAARSKKVPFIANITGLGSAVENESIVQKILIMLYKFAFRDVKKVFFQNTANMQFFESKKIAIGKYGLLPGSGVNLEKYEIQPYPECEKYHFLFISRIMKEKGIDQYLEAAQKIREKYQNTEFHICGFCEEEYEEKLQKLQKEGAITYHGLINNVSEFLKEIHCVVHPTYYPEGLSNVLLEACASGRPIITTNRPGCREVVENGKNGFVVEERNADDLFHKIEQFILLSDEDKKNMGVFGRKKVENEFNREIVIEAYMKEINE